jgi:hypothetical protein
MDVMQAMLSFQPTKNTRIGMNLKKLQEEFLLVYECTSLMFPEKKTEIVKKAISMLGLILYKVVVYVNRYSVVGAKEKDYYFKDDLTFSVRHSNITLYTRLKELVGDVKNRFTIEIIEKLYSRSKPALTRIVNKRHAKFGDPTFSFQSYFDYLDTGKDWFEVNDIVKLEDKYLKDDYFAAIWFGGYSNKDTVDKKTKELISIIEEDKNWKVKDTSNPEPFLLQYNDPFQPPWKRRNEILIKVVGNI